MEDFRTAINILEEGDFMASIDLKDAFLMIPIHLADRKYLRFIYNRKLYQFTALPFGLASSPFVYTKILRAVLAWLRKRGIRVTNYLDDFLFFGRTISECLEFIKLAMKLLESLGFLINFSKSNLTPNRRCRHLGIIIDSSAMTIEITKEKKQSIKNLIDKVLIKQGCRFDELMSLIGKLVAACPAVKSGWLYYKSLEHLKYIQGPIVQCDRKKFIQFPEPVLIDLEWWSKNIPQAYNFIRKFRFDYEIFSDASGTGWGAICGNKNARGSWSVTERKNHINYLELLASFLALKSFAANKKNCQILMRIDNITAISYINKMGGIKYLHLNNVTREIWSWCNKRNIWIFAEYVASKENPADIESRISNPDTEWELANFAFQRIVERFGAPEIDLFASRINKKCSLYCSWQRDPDAHKINAFTTDWSAFFWYAFPPFSLITKVLKKIREDKATGILIVPFWQTQPWYPIFLEMLIDNPIVFNPSSSLLLSSCREKQHPLSHQLSLIAGHISARLTKKKFSTRGQSTSYLRLGPRVRTSNTIQN